MSLLSFRRRVDRYDFFVLVVLLSSACIVTGLLSVLALGELDENSGRVASATPSRTPLPVPKLNAAIATRYDAGEPIVLAGWTIGGATVTVQEGERTLVTTTADDSGMWQATIEDGLAAGNYTLAITTSDASQNSERLWLWVDVQPRTLGGIPSEPATSIYGEVVVNVTPPTVMPIEAAALQSDEPLQLSGTVSEARFVAVLNGDTVLRRVEVNIFGRWHAEITLDPAQSYALGVQAIDADGNRSRVVGVPIRLLDEISSPSATP